MTKSKSISNKKNQQNTSFRQMECSQKEIKVSSNQIDTPNIPIMPTQLNLCCSTYSSENPLEHNEVSKGVLLEESLDILQLSESLDNLQIPEPLELKREKSGIFIIENDQLINTCTHKKINNQWIEGKYYHKNNELVWRKGCWFKNNTKFFDKS
jgi:hypothetical protein